MSTPLLSRAALAPRSTLHGGAIAGAVVGSLIGVLVLVLFCTFPFLRRRWRNRHGHGDVVHQAEMGQSQSPGGRISPPHLDDAKRLSGDPLVPDSRIPNGHPPATDPGLGNGTTLNHKAASDQDPHLPPTGVGIHQGLPSPLSPPLSPAPRQHSPPPTTKATDDGQAYPTPPPDEPSLPLALSRSRLHHQSIGTSARESTRELSFTDSYSYGPPSREVTYTSAGITEEPEALDQSSQSGGHRHLAHISGSIRSLIRRGYSGHQRRDSKRSATGGTDGARSPSIITTDLLTQPEYPPEPPQPAFEEAPIDPRGAAWSYYNDPDLISPDPQASYTAPATTSSSTSPGPPLSVVPPAHAPAQAAFHPGFPAAGAAHPMIGAPNVVEEPGLISPDSDQTITPRDPYRSFSRQTSLLKNIRPLQRTDSLPIPSIFSDIRQDLSPPAGPSGNPMEMMKPTNAVESSYYYQQEIAKMDTPSPPAVTSVQHYMEPLQETYIKHEPSPQSDYQSPPDMSMHNQMYNEIDLTSMLQYPEQYVDDLNQYDNPALLSDFSTPPPFSDMSAHTTPNTQISDAFTASPSPRSDIVDPRIGAHMGASPRTFPCDQCHREFDQVHKLNHHKRYHDRPHECPHVGCVMRFGTKTHLDRHINDKHNKTRKFYCTQHECPYSKQGGKSFPRKDNWRRHMMNKHRISPETDPVEYVDDTMTG